MAVSFFLVAGCGASKLPSESLEPTLAESRAAQSELREILADWANLSDRERYALEDALRRFVMRYEEDDSARLARVHLAWILSHTERVDQARFLLVQVLDGPRGSTRDFAQVVNASILARSKSPELALSLLRPLDGKIVDAAQRQAYAEARAQAAISARSYEEAIAYVHDWLAQAQERESESVKRRVRALLDPLPVFALEQGLARLQQGPSHEADGPEVRAAHGWLERAIRETLAERALADQDPELARRLLSGGLSATPGSDQGTKLHEIAARGSVTPRIRGRTLGLVLSVSDSEGRRRSVEVSAALVEALGTLSSGAPESAAPKLIVRDDRQGTRVSLSALAGEGAALLVAGLDEGGAREARDYAERNAVPVLLLHAPGDDQGSRFAFQLGAAPSQAADALLAELSRRGATRTKIIGPGGVSCTLLPAQAGFFRFPVAAWRADQVQALLLLGDASCAEDVAGELDRAGWAPLLALGLGAAGSAELFERSNVVAVHAGRFPSDGRAGMLSFYAALGHDAATLAKLSLSGLPDGLLSEPAAVASAHRKVAASLSHARAELWSTDAAGFDGARILPRRFEARAPRQAAAASPGATRGSE